MAPTQEYESEIPDCPYRENDSLNFHNESITLFYRPGHYEIMYSKKDVRAYPDLINSNDSTSNKLLPVNMRINAILCNRIRKPIETTCCKNIARLDQLLLDSKDCELVPVAEEAKFDPPRIKCPNCEHELTVNDRENIIEKDFVTKMCEEFSSKCGKTLSPEMKGKKMCETGKHSLCDKCSHCIRCTNPEKPKNGIKIALMSFAMAAAMIWIKCQYFQFDLIN